jgi:hypothetical protein
MTIISIAVIWLVVGLVAAVIFGTIIRRTDRRGANWHDDDGLPQQVGAQIQYMRRSKRAHCHADKSAMPHPIKRHSTKRHAG